MCFFNAMSLKATQVASRYGKQLNLFTDSELKKMESRYRIEAFSKDTNFIITNNSEIQGMQWGLIPFWAKSREDAEKIRMGTRNARAEEIFDKASYRNPIMKNRCLIPCTGYFEYHYENGKVDSVYFVFVKAQPIFSIGGVYDSWRDKITGEVFTTYSMITVEANELTGYIHNGGKHPNRMPLILHKEDEVKWLDSDLSKEQIKELMKTFPAELMDAYEVKKDFRNKINTNPNIIECVE